MKTNPGEEGEDSQTFVLLQDPSHTFPGFQDL